VNEPREVELDATVEGMLALARRETSVLAAALQRHDDNGILIAGARVRWSLACAQQFAARSHAALIRMRPQLVRGHEAAERWLPQTWGTGADGMSPEQLQRMLYELRMPSFGLRAICADDTLMADFDLDALPLSGITLRGATVAQVTARRARLDSADATRSHIVRSHFQAASLRASILDQAVFEACDLSKANLEETRLRYALLSHCRAVGAVFHNADLEGARFVDCDLRDTDWRGSQEAFSRGAEFVRCDLREARWTGRNLFGVSFIDCKLYGVHGQATGLDEALIERADLSHAGDSSRVGTKADVLASWDQDEWTDRSVIGDAR
jgi:uncharacterized protein YjbI with pentapeptide repeats